MRRHLFTLGSRSGGLKAHDCKFFRIFLVLSITPDGHFVTPYNESGKADCHDPLPGHLLPQPLCIMAKDLAVTEENGSG
jgi:hypothetical protein